MKRSTRALRRLALMVTAIFSFMTIAVPVAQAGMISAERYSTPSLANDQRTKMQRFLQREDVRAELTSLGVDPELAQTRADTLSDAELARTARLIDESAGSGVAGTIVLIFMVLVITEVIGITDVFTFVRT